MKLDEKGNYTPWEQPEYGYDAEGEKVNPEDGFRLLPKGELIRAGDKPFDVYSGWLDIGYNHFDARNGHFTHSHGRWTTWERNMNGFGGHETSPKVIDSFAYEYAFLSNFYVADIWYDGIKYPSTEHAFQAAKTLKFGERKTIAEMPTPGRAKGAGRLVTLREGWEEIKIQIMKEIVWIKFLTHTDLRMKLMQTGDATLIEGNTWQDKCWGMVKENGQWVGENHLGLILMELRSKLRN
jgi:ribA/ribD-fused uncharacterized protein